MSERVYAIYVRVSSDSQTHNKEGSIASQQQRCQEYLKFKYGEVQFVVYREEGKSGKDTNRTEFQRLSLDIQRSRIQAVVCTELSRISRSVIDFHQFLAMCNQNDVGFISLREQFDTTSAHGKLMMNIFACFAQFEREQISERTSANLQARARRGLYNGGYVYGYRPRPGQKGYIDIDKDEAIVVNLMFDKYLETGSYCKVANWLNGQGYRTREYITRSGKKKPACNWTKNTVIQCLRNPIFIGKRKLNDGQVISGLWDSIVSNEKWYKVQSLLAANLKSRGSTVAEVKHSYLFGGLIKCAHCGVFLESSSGTSRTGENYFYYRHIKRKDDCPNKKAFPAKSLEEYISSNLLKILDDNDLIKMICENVTKMARQQKLAVENEVLSIEKQIQGIDGEAGAITKKLPLLPDEQVKELIVPVLQDISNRKKQLLERKTKLESNLFHLIGDIIKEEDIKRTFYALGKDFWLLKNKEKQDLFKTLIEKIEMFKDTMNVHVKEVSSEGGSYDTQTGCPLRVSQRTLVIPIPNIYNSKSTLNLPSLNTIFFFLSATFFYLSKLIFSPLYKFPSFFYSNKFPLARQKLDTNF